MTPNSSSVAATAASMQREGPNMMRFSFAKIVEAEPFPVSSMSLNSKDMRLAVFRGGEHGHIEIWNVEHNPFMETILLDMEKVEGKASVESMTWAQGRLLTCGLHGFLIEHNIFSGLIKTKLMTTSGPAWCLSGNPSETIVAVGTEDGFINLFAVKEELSYIRVLDRQEGRVLCLSWSSCAKYICSGSADSVRIWDVNKGHAVHRMGTGRTKNKETIVWSILFLNDYTVVTGDSRGFVCFWDGKLGVLKFKIQTHKADVLALTHSADQSVIYASGVDPIIVLLTKLKSNGKWLKSHQRVVHVADVLCLETSGKMLFSGGVDSCLGVSYFPPKIIKAIPPMPMNVDFCCPSSLLLMTYLTSLDIWKLSVGDGAPPTRLLTLHSKHDDVIFSSCINSSGTILGYTSLATMKFFHVSDMKTKPAITAIKLITEDVNREMEENMFYMRFITDKLVLLISNNGKSVVFIDIDLEKLEGQCISVKNFDNLHFSGPVLVYDVKTCDRKALVALTPNCIQGNILIYSVNDFNLKIVSNLPSYKTKATSCTFHSTKEIVLVTYADNRVVFFHYKSGKILWEDFILPRTNCFKGAVWSADGDSAVLFHRSRLVLLSTTDALPKYKARKNVEEKSDFNVAVKFFDKKFKYLVHVLRSDKDFVGILLEPDKFLHKLPPALTKKRFGC